MMAIEDGGAAMIKLESPKGYIVKWYVVRQPWVFSFWINPLSWLAGVEFLRGGFSIQIGPLFFIIIKMTMLAAQAEIKP
jgi:hypothetical protein